MPVEIELINCLVFMLGLAVGIIYVLYKHEISKKAKRWQSIYGNTDFENPYR